MNYETNNIEILLPNNPIVIKFLKLNNKEQLKVIELGQLFLTNGQHKIQYWNNEETEQIIKNIKKKSNNEINELKTELTLSPSSCSVYTIKILLIIDTF